MSVYLDTHVAVWLGAGLVERLSSEAKRHIETNDLLISPIVLLEFQYLFRKGRTTINAAALYSHLNSTFGIFLCDIPFAAVSFAALTMDWSPDPFDRLIVAQAASRRQARLVTADKNIRQHYAQAAW